MIDPQAARSIKAWPFAEAAALAERCASLPGKGYVLFETGYGPSGLPHIGTFGEVVRTTMVRQAFASACPTCPTRLVLFSPTIMDGLRKVPDNIPNPEMVAAHLGKPLTKIPDPFGTDGELRPPGNNARLRGFLDTLWLRVRVRQSSSALLPLGPLRRRRSLTVLARYDDDDGDHVADPGARAPARPTARSCRSAPRTGVGSCRCR